MRAIELVQRLFKRLPLPTVPTTISGTSDAQVLQMLQIIQDVGDDIQSRHDWQKLITPFTFTTTGADPQGVNLPDGWDRFLPDASLWRSGSKITPLSGPCPPDVWHRLLTIPGNRFPGYWRLADQQMQIIGAPSGETTFIEYITKYWVLASDGSTYKNTLSNDDDTILLPSRLIYLAALWQWKESEGLQYSEDMVNFEKQFERDCAADRAARPISTRHFIDADVPLNTFPGTITVSS